MNALRLVRAEMRKLTTTAMPWAFLVVLVAFGGINAALVVYGTDIDGSKAFIATADDQQSMVAFAANAMMIAGFLGAIAVAREYGHGTVVPTFLTTPRRHRAALSQFIAVLIAGGVLGFLGSGITMTAVAVALRTTDYGFLMSAADVARVLSAATFAGAAGALLGAGIGAVVRNTGGAVTVTVLALIIAPPLIVQLFADASSWVPSILANVVAGVEGDVSTPAALVALALWAIVPAAAGLIAIERRDVV